MIWHAKRGRLEDAVPPWQHDSLARPGCSKCTHYPAYALPGSLNGGQVVGGDEQLPADWTDTRFRK